MTKNFCDRCRIETESFPSTTVDIRWGFWRTVKHYMLCKDCDQILRNIVTEFLGR